MNRAAQTETPDPNGSEPAEEWPDETGPQRRCLITREHGDRARMLRFVVGPGDVLVSDPAASLPGRGLWLSAGQDVVEAATANRVFSRAARRKIVVPDDLVHQVREGLMRRFLETLGLARRAGQSVAGFQKAQAWLISNRAGLVVQASDGSTDECARFLRWPGGSWTGKRIAPLPAHVLGGVFGRDHAVHVVVAPGRLAAMLQIEAERLAGFPAPSAANEGPGGTDEAPGDR